MSRRVPVVGDKEGINSTAFYRNVKKSLIILHIPHTAFYRNVKKSLIILHIPHIPSSRWLSRWAAVLPVVGVDKDFGFLQVPYSGNQGRFPSSRWLSRWLSRWAAALPVVGVDEEGINSTAEKKIKLLFLTVFPLLYLEAPAIHGRCAEEADDGEGGDVRPHCDVSCRCVDVDAWMRG